VKLRFGRAEAPENGRRFPAPWRASPAVQVAVPIESNSLHLVVAWLGDGDSIDWPPEHGEEAVYVLAGELEIDGRRVPAGGALLLHGNAECRLVARGAARLAHFSTSAGGGGDGQRHLVGPAGWARSGRPGAAEATWFADSTCDGCDITLLRVERDTPGNRGRPHEHSADEILFVVEGGISLGAHDVPLHHAVFIPAGTRYAVNCGPVKHAFLNYRATASTQQYAGDAEPMVETALGRDGELVGDWIA
jgi:hypothetical protein